MSAYARLLGKTKQFLSQCHAAAKVSTQLDGLDKQNLLDKAKHLSHIHALPSPTWPLMVQTMLDQEWSAADTKKQKTSVKNVLDVIPEWWEIDPLLVVQTITSESSQKSTLSAIFKEANALYSKLKVVTIYNHQKTGEKTEIDGREMFIAEPVPEQFDQKEGFKESLSAIDDTFPELKQIRDAYKLIIEKTERKSDKSIRHIPVLTDEEIEEHEQRQKELYILEMKERYTPRIIHGDVFEELPQLRDGSIDLVCVDPPYNMDKTEWDSYGSGKEYADWCSPWIKECQRVLTETGSMYVFGRNRMLSHIQHILDGIGMVFRDWITWDTIQGAGGFLYPNRQENILFYSKTDKTYKDADAIKLERHEQHIREYKGKEYKFKTPSNIWRFPCVDDKDADRTGHPTQKPINLISRIVTGSCPVDGVVLDPFCGSGTTLVSAMQNTRRSIGIDNNHEYIGISKGRTSKIEINY